MDRLPDLPLLLIFRFIDNFRKKTRLERVCRRWRKIMLKEGWKHVRRITLVLPTHLEHMNALMIGPIGHRCGSHLVECRFHGVDMDSTMIRLVGQNFPALKHLFFDWCKLEEWDATSLQIFRQLANRLRSLTFDNMPPQHRMDLNNLLPLSDPSPPLLHLGLDLSQQQQVIMLPQNGFFAASKLRSLYLKDHNREESNPAEQILAMVLSKAPGLMALYVDINSILINDPQQFMSRIFSLENLHFLHLSFFPGSEMLSSGLDKLPFLIALEIYVPIQHLPNVFQSSTFCHVVHLHLSLDEINFHNYQEPIGRLAMVAPRLRSLSLHIHTPSAAPLHLQLAHAIGCEVLKIAHNGLLEYLNVPCASFTVGELNKLVLLCTNLHTLDARLWPYEQIYQVVELRSVVADQWRAGTRKHLPLRIWICDQDVTSGVHMRDSFLTIRFIGYDDMPSNPVLEALLHDEVFSDGGGTPAFVSEHYSSSINWWLSS